MPTYVETPVTDPTANALLAEYFAYRAETFPSPAGYVTAFPSTAAFTPPDGVFLVVEQEGAAIGCGGIRSLGGGRFEVKHLWLRPSVQGRGFGRQLLAELERRARLLGATELVLDTNASLEAAGGLYRSSGYADIEPYNDNPNANVWLRKVLAPTASSREHLVEAIAWWRLRLPEAHGKLVEASVALLVGGDEHASVAEMAGVPTTENRFSVDSLVERIADDLALGADLAGPPEIIAAKPMCRALLAGQISEQRLCGWVHDHLHHEVQSELLSELAVASDDYEGVAGGWNSTPTDVLDARVRTIASALLGATE